MIAIGLGSFGRARVSDSDSDGRTEKAARHRSQLFRGGGEDAVALLLLLRNFMETFHNPILFLLLLASRFAMAKVGI